MKKWLLSLTHSRRAGALVGLFLLCALLSALSPFFFTPSNLMNVMEQTAINAVIAVGMTFVILSAGIDLSVGSITALSGVVHANRLGQADRADRRPARERIAQDYGGSDRGWRIFERRWNHS